MGRALSLRVRRAVGESGRRGEQVEQYTMRRDSADEAVRYLPVSAPNIHPIEAWWSTAREHIETNQSTPSSILADDHRQL